MIGTLESHPAATRLDLLAAPTAAMVKDWSGPVPVDDLEVAEIDPDRSDTAEFCAHYGVDLAQAGNCVIVAARRGGETTLAACVVLATNRADVNGLVRRHLGARKVSFAAMDTAVAESGMEYGGVTPIGLPTGWPILVDRAVADTERVLVGSGVRRSKIMLPGAALAGLPGAQVLDDLGR